MFGNREMRKDRCRDQAHHRTATHAGTFGIQRAVCPGQRGRSSACRPSAIPPTPRSCSSTALPPRCSGGRTSSANVWRPGPRYVIRYDHRDTGRSVSYEPGAPPYSLPDLAADAVGLLDAFGLARAHLVGRSMGGGIAMLAALDHPERVASLTLIGTSPGGADLPPMSRAFLAHTGHGAPDWSDRAAVTAHIMVQLRVYAGDSEHFDEATMREPVMREVDRTTNVASSHDQPFCHGHRRADPGAARGDCRADARHPRRRPRLPPRPRAGAGEGDSPAPSYSPWRGWATSCRRRRGSSLSRLSCGRRGVGMAKRRTSMRSLPRPTVVDGTGEPRRGRVVLCWRTPHRQRPRRPAQRPGARPCLPTSFGARSADARLGNQSVPQMHNASGALRRRQATGAAVRWSAALLGSVMCRNIRTLFNFAPPATDDEIRAASLQFVRKISGFTKPSRANEAAFAAAVDDVAQVSARLLASLEAAARAEEP